MNPKMILGGMKSYVPWLCDFTGTGGTTVPAYCYSVWLRHLAIMHGHGLPTEPKTVVELGPGDSIGVGLAAMLCGAESYRALDVVRHSDLERDTLMLEELVDLLTVRERIPGDNVFPGLYPRLQSYDFPEDVLTRERLARSLVPDRIAGIRDSLRRAGDPSDTASPIRYICPWTDASSVETDSADLVLSHVVLQDIVELPAVFDAMRKWLRPGGIMSHQIDFSSADKEGSWNNHWAYSDQAWRLVRGRRPYYINREPLSTYLRLFGENGFRVIAVTPRTNQRSHPREQLAASFRNLDDADMTTSAAHILAVRQ